MLGERLVMVSQRKEHITYFLRSGVNVALILLALNLITVNLAIIDSSIMLVATFFLLVGVIIFNFPFKKLYKTIKEDAKEHTFSYTTIIGVILIIFSFVLLLATKMQFLWLISIPILLSGLDKTLRGVQIEYKELSLLSIASFAFTIFYMLVLTIPTAWYFIQQFSLLFSKTIGALVNQPLLLGPSTSGLWIVIIFTIFSCCILLVSDGKKRYFIFNLIGLGVSWIVFLIILRFVEFESNGDVLNLHYLLFLFGLVPTFMYLSQLKFKTKPFGTFASKERIFKHGVKNGAVWSLVFLFISGIMLSVFPGINTTAGQASKKNILLYGHNMLGTWDIPEYGRYERLASGMFGLLPYYLNNSGYHTQIVVNNVQEFLNATFPPDENVTRYLNLTDYMTIIASNTITKELLSNVDILVVINLNTSFSPDEQKNIWDFVEKGGSLLVLGDHTNIGEIMNPLNNLLKPVKISYRFDDALPLDSSFQWIPCYQFTYHPIKYPVDSLDEIGISVGASLNISADSFPIIIGRYGLSDEGNRLNSEGAFLGDYQYNKGEQLGDIILAAAAYYGNGKVLVFGDTSSFQNSAIPNSLPFLESVFSWLSSTRTATIEYTQLIISVVLLLGAFVLYHWFGRKDIQFVVIPLALCLALIISAVINPVLLTQPEIKENVMYVDASHVERYDLELYNNNSLTGTMINLMRNRYLPIVLREFSKETISNSEMILFNAPTKMFTQAEVQLLKQYISHGGLLVISTGFPDKDASMPLLREFQLDIDEIPLGPIPYVEENPEDYQKNPRFVDAWPILIGDNNTDILYSINISNDTYVLMTFTKSGNGGLLLIGDSEFLTDKNIESLNDYWPGNIQFLKNILDEMKTRGVLR
jgi:hypothetical protein